MTNFKSTIAIFFVIILVLFSCNKKENKINEIIPISGKMSDSVSVDKVLAHIPMPAKLDSAMRQNFDTITYKVLKKLNPRNVKSFHVSKDNYLKMIDNIPENADRVAFSFVQFNKANFPNKYRELTKYDGCLYLVYYYMDAYGRNVTNKAYAMLGIQNIIEISATDFQVMENDYTKNIKPSIDKLVKGPQGNTLRVKMSKNELVAYKNRATTKPNIRNFKITLAQWVDYNHYLTKSELNFLLNKLSQFSDNSVGQITFITDCQGNNGGDINDLSGFDQSHFCPEDCP